VFEEFLKTPEVRYNKPIPKKHFTDHLKSMLHSEPTQRNHGHIIEECKPLCLVPSHEGPMRSIQAVHPSNQQRKSSMLSTQRRMKLRIVLVLHLIHPWLTHQQPMDPLLLLQLSFHLAPYCLERHPLSYHLFFHKIVEDVIESAEYAHRSLISST